MIENFFGGTPDANDIRALSESEIEDFGDRILESANAQALDPVPTSTYYPGGFLAGRWQHRQLSTHLHLALLYYPRLLVHDPLADFFFRDFHKIPQTRGIRAVDGAMSVKGGPAIWGRHVSYVDWRQDGERVRNHLASVIAYMLEVAPLLRTGVLVTRPQWPTLVSRQQAIMASVRRDVTNQAMQSVVEEARASGDFLPVWDHLWGLNVMPGAGVDPRDELWVNQHEFLYLAKTLGIADQAGATFVPPQASELRLLRTKLQAVSARISPEPEQPIELLGEVARILVPDLQMDARTAVAIRVSEPDFDDWRRALSRIARSSRGESPQELRARVEDELIPVKRRVEKAIATGKTLKAAARDQSATTVISGGIGAGAAALAGGSPGVVVASAIGNGVLQWLWKAYRPPSLGGTDAVIASLLRAEKGSRKVRSELPIQATID